MNPIYSVKMPPARQIKAMGLDRFKVVFRKDIDAVMRHLRQMNSSGPAGSGFCGFSVQIFARERSSGQILYRRESIEKALFDQEIHPGLVSDIFSIFSPFFLLGLHAEGKDLTYIRLSKIKKIESPEEFMRIDKYRKFEKLAELGVISIRVHSPEELRAREEKRTASL